MTFFYFVLKFSRKSKKIAAVIDEVPNQVAQLVSQVISKPLSYMINKSFLQCKSLVSLKISQAVPIRKNKDSKDKMTNLRNLNMSYEIDIIIESCFQNRLIKYLKSNKLL